VKSNNTHLNILVSYAYLGKSKKLCDITFGPSRDGITNIMIDSGAFTLFNSTNGKMGWLNIDNYCKFLDTFGQFSEKYVMLDVINNHEASKDNYELMLKRDLNPMFVFTTYDNDYTYLKQAVARNPHICVAGGVTSYRQWMQKRYQDVYKNTQALMHGLGFVKFPDMLQLPLHSVDSSSWVQASQVFGILRYFDEGMKGPRYIDVLKRKVALPEQIKQLLDKFKVTPKDFSNLDNHKGLYSIATMLSIVAHIEYQKYCKKRGLNLFLACAKVSDLRDILYINEELEKNTLTYEKFAKRNRD
jgi:hypothetical protein